MTMVYSWLSIHAVLSLIAADTKGHTPTEKKLLSFLKSKSTVDLNSLASDIVPLVFADQSPRGEPRLSFVNGLWVDKSTLLKPCFKRWWTVFTRRLEKKSISRPMPKK
ncbi:hypothetical protein C1H46_001571 [Malus baccata]|uniref:Uncharacterized protein n=1 Tax=Malus baccata TaxID=106549 RepID=A0A540NPH3_MALBA|nr:hypothetical protein C1H46_001571 [Malus baccata]